MPEYMFCPEEGEPTQVPLEPWTWIARYSDGTCLRQFDENFRYRRTSEIDQSRMVSFEIVDTQNTSPIRIPWVNGRSLIYYYQVTRLDVGEPTESMSKLYCFGYNGPDGAHVTRMTSTGNIIG